MRTGSRGLCSPDGVASHTETAHSELSGFDPLPPANPLAAGTPTDPDLLDPVVPWEMVLTDEEVGQVAVLADLIIPPTTAPPPRARSERPIS